MIGRPSPSQTVWSFEFSPPHMMSFKSRVGVTILEGHSVVDGIHLRPLPVPASHA